MKGIKKILILLALLTLVLVFFIVRPKLSNRGAEPTPEQSETVEGIDPSKESLISEVKEINKELFTSESYDTLKAYLQTKQELIDSRTYLTYFDMDSRLTASLHTQTLASVEYDVKRVVVEDIGDGKFNIYLLVTYYPSMYLTNDYEMDVEHLDSLNRYTIDTHKGGIINFSKEI